MDFIMYKVLHKVHLQENGMAYTLDDLQAAEDEYEAAKAAKKRFPGPILGRAAALRVDDAERHLREVQAELAATHDAKQGGAA